MKRSMRRFLRRRVRPIASTLLLAFAVASSAECLTIGLTPEQKACCATMPQDCGEMAVESSCCASETHQADGVVATKPAVAVAPVATLLAILSAPAVSAPSSSRLAFTTETSSAGPPGVPTYLFVSSFRI